MIVYPPSLKAAGGARTGIAPAHLLDVQDVNGNLYYWSDRPLNVPVVIDGSISSLNLPAVPTPPPSPLFTVPPGSYLAWAYPTVASFPAGGAGTAVGTVTSAELSMTSAVNGGRGDAAANWSAFAAPTLPPGIDAALVYPVVTLKASIAESAFSTDTSNFSIALPAKPFVLSGTFVGAVQNITPGSYPGGLPAWLTNSHSDWSLDNSLIGTGFFDFCDISFIGFALVYTGGTPPSPGPPPPSGWNLPGQPPYGSGPYLPWIVKVPSFAFHRSMQTDIGSFILQNLSGDSLSRDFEKIRLRSTLEGAFFVYRLYQVGAAASWLEVHGTLTVAPAGTDTVQLKAAQLLNPSQEDTPLEIFCETCQLQWGGRRCGSTQATECQYSFATCQVVERPMMVLNDFEKNYGEAMANTATNVINRRRKI